MDKYTNEKGEQVVIAKMDNHRLVHAIAKYAELESKDSDLVKALKAEVLVRLTPKDI